MSDYFSNVMSAPGPVTVTAKTMTMAPDGSNVTWKALLPPHPAYSWLGLDLDHVTRVARLDAAPPTAYAALFLVSTTVARLVYRFNSMDSVVMKSLTRLSEVSEQLLGGAG